MIILLFGQPSILKTEIIKAFTKKFIYPIISYSVDEISELIYDSKLINGVKNTNIVIQQEIKDRFINSLNVVASGLDCIIDVGDETHNNFLKYAKALYDFHPIYLIKLNQDGLASNNLYSHVEVIKEYDLVIDSGDISVSKIVYQMIGFIKDNLKPSAFEHNLSDQIVIEEYDENWPLLAQSEIELLKQAIDFKWLCDIEHYGSTSIKGIKAKPILDIIIGVKDIKKAVYMVPIVEKMGYKFWQDNPDQDHLFFVKGMPPFDDKRTHHIRVFEVDSYKWFARRIFRYYLNTNPKIKIEY